MGWPRRTMVLASLILTTSRLSHADGSGSAEAEELFQQGRTALEAHDYPLACAKFDSSLQLERAVGTLMSLAECEEATNKLVSARQHWHEAADLADARNDPLRRGAFGRQKFAALDARVPWLLVRLAPGAPEDTVLHRDEVTLGRAAFDVELPTDPGAHVLAVSANGRETNRYVVDLAEGQHKAIDVGPGPAVAAAAVAASSLPSAQMSAPPLPALSGVERPVGSKRPQHTVAYVVGGLGVVGIGVGAYFGLSTISEWKTARDLCPCDGETRAAATQHQTAAQTDATVSTIAFVAGGAGVAAGLVLWLAAPSARPAEKTSRLTLTPTLAPHAMAFAVHGAW